MLWKLLKYDFRAMWKQFSLIWPAALVVALINRFTLPFDEGATIVATEHSDWLSAITMMVFVGVMIAMFVVAMIFIIRRFYQGLLGDEGYLMHTLPVHSWQLVGSKLVCAVFVTIISIAVAMLAMVLIIPVDWRELFTWRLWQDLYQGLFQHPDTILVLVEACLLFVALLVLGITQLYLSMSVGHLFHRHRVLMSVVAYFGLNILMDLAIDNLDLFSISDFLTMVGSDHMAFLVMVLICLVPSALFFWGASYILKNRLNLE